MGVVALKIIPRSRSLRIRSCCPRTGVVTLEKEFNTLEEVLRCLLRQEKERCPFAFIVEKGEVSVCLYRRKRRGVRLPLS